MKLIKWTTISNLQLTLNPYSNNSPTLYNEYLFVHSFMYIFIQLSSYRTCQSKELKI